MSVEPIGVRRSALRLVPDPRRVVARLFVPGQEGFVDGESRAGSVIGRVLDLGETQTVAALAEVTDRFAGRHHDLPAVLAEHFAMIVHRIPDPAALSSTQRQLIGAYFTQEYAVEAAAVCNPSMVAHPDQGRLGPGETRFVMSVRAIGEGHRSSIEFRTGVVGSDAVPRLDDLGPHLVMGRPREALLRRDLFERVLRDSGDAGPSTSYVLDSLGDSFSSEELGDALDKLHDQLVTRSGADRMVARMLEVAACNYEVTFPEWSSLGERVLGPQAPIEASGMEDARFVRFVEEDGSSCYHATYTAWDGANTAVQLLSTEDFQTFRSSQMVGRGATNKGMALFPRKVGGRYAALSRWDRTTNSVVLSDRLEVWDSPISLPRPWHSWDLVQLGNCGSPIESPIGWVVLTHGVGPLRRYVIGADLLDLEDPTRVIGSLTEPLVVPTEEERDGYVPNVVYSCGAMLHGEDLLIPLGLADSNIGVVSVAFDDVLDRLAAGPHPDRG